MSTTPAKARFATNPYPVDSATLTTTIPTVPVPAGATSVDDWCLGRRLFWGSTDVTVDTSGWLDANVCIYAGGSQEEDGAYEWQIVAGPLHPDNPLTAAQARQIGAALTAAADELDALAAADEAAR